MLLLLFFCLLVHQGAADLKKLEEYLNLHASLIDNKGCTDFYQYFCGNWNESISARRKNSSDLLNDFEDKLKKQGNNLPTLYNKAKWLYESCKEFEGMDKEKTTEVLVNSFSEMTGGVTVPLLDQFWQPHGKNPFETDAIVEKMSKSNLLVQFDTERTEWSKSELRISPVSFNFSSITRAHVNTWLAGLGALSRQQQMQVDDMIALLRYLQDIQSKARTNSEEAAAMPLADLIWRVPQIDWQVYLQAIQPGFSQDMMVEVVDLESLKQIGMAIQNFQFTHPAAFDNLLAYRFFTVVGQLKQKEVCLSKFAPFLNPLAQYLWREEGGKGVDKRLDISLMERGVRNSFSNMIQSSWLDKESQLNSLNHLKNLDAKYMDNQPDEDKLEALAKDLSISEGNNVLENFFALVDWNRTQPITAETGVFGNLPFFSDALSWSDQKSQIIFGLPLLQEPLFSPEYPTVVKYGALGSRIGRELAMSFSSEESVSRLFTKHDMVAFADKIACFKNQTNRNCKDCTSEIQETIANILGINASFAAFLREPKAFSQALNSFTIRRLHEYDFFMLAWAKPYCTSDPMKVKRNRNLINSVVRGLGKDFGCFDKKTKCDLFSATIP